MADTQPLFVKSARISAHLYVATEVAREISLTSKNARAITVRAGQRAAGFIAITDFIESLAKSMITLSESINKIAIRISQITSDKVRAEIAHRDFQTVLKKAYDAKHINSIMQAIEATHNEIVDFDTQFDVLIDELEEELQESYKHTRTANVLVSTSKVEAAQAGEFQQALEVIADNLDCAANAIRKQLHTAENILDEAKRINYESNKNR